jgi:phosphoribosyl-ATP pyrophosphohydrolase
MKMNNLIKNVLDWAKEKEILNPDNRFKQFAKTAEELSEYFDASHFEDQKTQITEMGDVLVCIIILMHQTGVSPFDIFQEASIISNRVVGPPNSGRKMHQRVIFRALANIASDLCKQASLEYINHSMTMFTITILSECKTYDLPPEKCLTAAHKKNISRKSTTVDGQVIKDSDLTNT